MNISDCRKTLSEIIKSIDTVDIKRAKIVINAVDKMLISAKDERRYNVEKVLYENKIPNIEFYENEKI